ncbi:MULTISPECIES: hypothetical protein [unclassified Methylobacterium]|uniref:hypothetical protein n=1 Tax=unclassified Methylobacterium TaxID=2615210 RepID=UPI00226A310B|nr:MULTISPECIES: hypothetical protein [unclassified Methylobacterium]
MTGRRPHVTSGGDTAELQAGDSLTYTLQGIVPVVGGSYQLDGSVIVVLEPVAALGSTTLTLPASPVDGQVVQVTSRYTISTLTVSAGTGKSIVGAPTTVGPTAPFGLVYRAASTTWFRI